MTLIFLPRQLLFRLCKVQMATLTELLGEDQIQQVCLKGLRVVKVEEDIPPFFMIAASESRHRTQVKLACFSVYRGGLHADDTWGDFTHYLFRVIIPG